MTANPAQRPQAMPKRATVMDVLITVCRVTGFSVDQMMGPHTYPEIVAARALYARLCVRFRVPGSNAEIAWGLRRKGGTCVGQWLRAYDRAVDPASGFGGVMALRWGRREGLQLAAWYDRCAAELAATRWLPLNAEKRGWAGGVAGVGSVNIGGDA